MLRWLGLYWAKKASRVLSLMKNAEMAGVYWAKEASRVLSLMKNAEMAGRVLGQEGL